MKDIKWCINYLKEKSGISSFMDLDDEAAFRALQNITMPYALSDEFYSKQDKVLKEILSKKKIVDTANFNDGISIYKGDITLINADAIVNACNNKLLGCFVPGHHCIDNAIHSFAGLQVRRDLMRVMEEQGHDEKNGRCKVTSAYNLPSRYIFHTVGPIYSGINQDDIDLENCYLSCLRKADEMKLESIVFCSLSTGIFGFPIEKASKIAVRTVKNYFEKENGSIKKVIFDVFSKNDYEVYKRTIEEIDR